MRAQTIRRGFILIIVDIVLIIGIFALQFRTDSSIIEKLGLMQITLASSEDQNNPGLKNKLQISYNGLNISIDDSNPARIYNPAKKQNHDDPVTLISYKKTDSTTYEFDFSEGVKLYASLSSLDSDANLTLHADVPAKMTFSVPYSYSYNTKIKKDDGNRVILSGKKSSWEMQAYSLANNVISFTSSNGIAMYSAYDDTQKFTFDSITELAIADSLQFNANLTTFKNNLINSFKNITVDANTSEQTVVSYIAAMAERGEYVRAVDDLPQAFKRSPMRTYLSAPYLNTLEEMNILLDGELSTNAALITESAANLKLDLFTVKGIAPYLCINSNRQNVITILQNAAATDFEKCTLTQAVGVLEVYVDLVKYDSTLAEILRPGMDSCVNRIASACALNGSVLTISENDTFLSVVQAVETGVAVLRYGLVSNSPVMEKAGYALVNSYLAEASSFDLRTLSNLYPILSFDNWYYPHFEKITAAGGASAWAWTCAKSITCSRTAADELSYTIDFPESYTHYVILKGVPRFHTIYIYDMAFRTDPRFETYNSSGYVYKRDSQTLLLKSRHRSEKEVIRIETGEAAPKTAAPVKTEPAKETEADSEAVEETEEPAVEENISEEAAE